MGKITVVGLGPGDFRYITMEGWEYIKNAEHLYFRTEKHPAAETIKQKGIKFESYDSFYEQADNFDILYEGIVNDLIKRAQSEDIVYAVPGSPLVAEKTIVLLREAEKNNNFDLDILPGMSFVEVLYTRLGIDPIDGLTIIDAEDLHQLPFDLPTGIVITQVYNKAVASDTKLSLMEYLPDDYEITLVHHLGLQDESVRKICLYELDRQADIDHLTSLYLLPPKQQPKFDLTPLIDVMRRLRSPGGCPWDIEQTHESLRTNIIEEVYEVIEAIDLQDKDLLCEELGDLLLQIVFHARMAEETGAFSMQDVVDGITEKLIRRHPHIFGDVQASDAAQVLINWEAIKKQEKPERTSAIDGIPQGLPALMYAWKLQKKAAKVGFDWEEIGPVWEKLSEELAELKEALGENNQKHIEEELGDMLFVIVNLSRFIKVQPELALLGTNKKFIRRFNYVEEQVKKSGKEWEDFSLNQLDKWWDEAKQAERG